MIKIPKEIPPNDYKSLFWLLFNSRKDWDEFINEKIEKSLNIKITLVNENFRAIESNYNKSSSDTSAK